MTHLDPFAKAAANAQSATAPCALAFDTAPDGFAWATAYRAGARRFRYGNSGHITGLTPSDIVREARKIYAAVGPTLLAVEGFGGYVSSARMKRQRTNALDISDLLQSAYVAGMLTASLPHPSDTVTLPANGPDGNLEQWRYWLTGQYRQGDKGVAQALDALLVGGLPRRGSRKGGAPIYAINDHRRDALGLAVASFLWLDYLASPQGRARR